MCLSSLVALSLTCCFIFFFFNDTATTEIYTLSLHVALPIFLEKSMRVSMRAGMTVAESVVTAPGTTRARSEEHTSELQSQSNLVCRLLLEKKNKEPTHIDRHSNTTGRRPAAHDAREQAAANV